MSLGWLGIYLGGATKLTQDKTDYPHQQIAGWKGQKHIQELLRQWGNNGADGSWSNKMKKIVLTLTLAALSTSAFAAEPAPMKATCPQIAELARLAMEARQIGAPLRTMMAGAEGTIMADILIEAYGHPAYRTSEVQDRAIQEFEDRWYLKCIKSYNQ